MYKLHRFLVILVILFSVSFNGFAQEPTTGKLTSSQATKTKYDEFLPLSISLYFSPEGFKKSTVKATVGIGKYDLVSPPDELTGFRQFVLKGASDLLDGNLGDLKVKLDAAVAAGKITKERRDAFLVQLVTTYSNLVDLTKAVQSILEDSGIQKIEPIEIKE